MKAPSPSDAFARESCGCPVERYRYPFKCPQHAALDGRLALPWHARNHDGLSTQWHDENCCPFCGRVNPYGLACDRSELCLACGVRSCHSHGQATYLLKIQCPHDTNPRTKFGRALLKSLTDFGRAMRVVERPLPFVDVSYISEYGLTQKLSNSIRVY